MHIVITTEGRNGQILSVDLVHDAVDETQAINRVKREDREQAELAAAQAGQRLPTEGSWTDDNLWYEVRELMGNGHLYAVQGLDACDDTDLEA